MYCFILTKPLSKNLPLCATVCCGEVSLELANPSLMSLSKQNNETLWLFYYDLKDLIKRLPVLHVYEVISVL